MKESGEVNVSDSGSDNSKYEEEMGTDINKINEERMDTSENGKSEYEDNKLSETEVQNNDEGIESSSGHGAFDACSSNFVSEVAKRKDGEDSTRQKTETPISKWNFDEIVFPNFGVDNNTVTLTKPSFKFTPGRLDVAKDEYSFLKYDNINQKKEKRKGRERKPNLRFSRPDVMEVFQFAKRQSKTWLEFKTMNRDKERKDMAPSLYTEELQPLVDPLHASSTGML